MKLYKLIIMCISEKWSCEEFFKTKKKAKEAIENEKISIEENQNTNFPRKEPLVYEFYIAEIEAEKITKYKHLTQKEK